MEKIKIELNDNWNLCSTESNNTIDGLYEVATAMTEITGYLPDSTANLRMITPGYTNSRKHIAKVQVLMPESLKEFNETLSVEAEDVIIDSEFNEELYDESMGKDVGFMLQSHDHFYYVSRSALPSLLVRAKLSGAGMLENDMWRNGHLAYRLYKIGMGEIGKKYKPRKTMSNPEDLNCELVYRQIKEGGRTYRKIFYVPSEKYTPIPLTVVPEIAEMICDDDVMGDPEMKYWYLDHDILETCIVFPDIAEEVESAYKLPERVLPGIRICSSDTGKSGINIKAIAFIGESRFYITLETTKRKHTGNVEVNSLIEEANEVILEKVRTLPGLLAQMTEKVIYEAGSGKTAIKKVYRAITKTFKYCGLTTILGKKREKELKDALIAELNPDRDYTEYDVASMIMKIGNRIPDATPFICEQLGEACARAPYAFKHDEDEEEELYLLPEEE